MLLLSVKEVAYQFGGLSPRTVFRMIQRGDLPKVKLGRLVRVPAQAVYDYVAQLVGQEHNISRVVPVAWKENKPCHTDEKTHQFGGLVSPMQAAIELDALLEQKTAKKQRHSKQNGNLRPIK